MIAARWTITIAILIYSGLLYSQPETEPFKLLRRAFDDLGEMTIWQISFHGNTENGTSLKLYLAYSDSVYMAYMEDDQGHLHYFEGKYHPEKLEWVQYEEDIIRGYLIGKRRDGVLSGEWMNSSRTEGKQIYLVQDGSAYEDKVPLLGAIYYMSGSLNGNSSTLFMDWQSDGRIRVDLYLQGNDQPIQFYRDDHFPSEDDWVFRPDVGNEKFHLQSPVYHSRLEAFLEKDRVNVEYGRFELVHQMIRQVQSPEPIPGYQIEWILSGKPGLDRRIREWVTDWSSSLSPSKGITQIWFEGTGVGEDLIFGRWWADPPGSDILPYRSVILDLRNEKILEWSEVLTVDGIPGRESARDQLILDAGKLCWEGPQHRIIGRTKHCVPLSDHWGLIHKRFSSRFKNRF